MTELLISTMRTEGRILPLGLDATAPMLGWTFAPSPSHSLMQTAYRIRVAAREELLTDGKPDVWDSGRRESGCQTAIAYEGGALEPRRRYYWQVTVWDEDGNQAESPISWWETGLLRDGQWSGRWIGDASGGADGRPLPRFRRSFRIGKPVRQARAYISGLGHYELRLNGGKVGDHELDPGWTEYDKTVLYTTYDITDALAQGENVAAILLGNGFYNVTGGRYTKFKDSYGAPKCLADLVIEYADGTSETIGTDGAWRAAASPLAFSCIYGGEDYDAALEQEGWDRPGFVEGSAWREASEAEAPSGELVAQSAPALKVMERLSPVAVTEPKPGVFVVDLGRNFSGWPEIAVSGSKGATVKLIPAELLTDEGLANQKWSGSPYEWNYTLKGEGTEIWRPRFTYYGFRYVQVEGVGAALASDTDGQEARGLPILHRMEGQMIYPDVRTTGSFRCSDDRLNRIHEIINRAMLSNMKSVLTDCPHREKLGWLEQVHLMGPSLIFNYDVEALLMKVLADIADAQQPDGLIPTTAPEYVVFQKPWDVFRHAAAWGGASVLAAWELLQRYGNAGALQRHYDTMRRYVDYLTANADGHILRDGLGDWYDVGPNGPGFSQNTPVPLAETAIYYGLTVVMQSIAARLGLAEDADVYARLADSIKAAFNREFFDERTALYAEGSDAALAMPLAIGLAPDAHRDTLFARLVRNVEERGGRTTSGDVGHRYVLLALARGGRSDLIYRMTRSTDTPGYGYQIANGATTLTEAWDGPTVGKSQNHFMLGHLEEWLYTGLAGLDYRYRPESGRFAVTVKPSVVWDVRWAEVRQELRAGQASVRWELGEGRELKVAVEIPINADGAIHIPAAEFDSVAVEGDGARFVGREEGFAVYRTGSGSFTFTRRESP
ncbi:family 78 glycoside hydrolase catalytic domain [Cohnella cellulosilytica]|uniref:alpha-L-rhamnosidase n=1 Tax=Cohnella cellulosilytica TaxID=986710 RepID=A0ABW2FEA8_9BACL